MESAETDKLCLEARRGIAAEALKETEGATRKLAKENAALRKERDRFLNEISDRKVTRVELEEVVRRLEAQRCEASPIRRRDQSSRHFRETTSDAGTSGEKRWPGPSYWLAPRRFGVKAPQYLGRKNSRITTTRQWAGISACKNGCPLCVRTTWETPPWSCCLPIVSTRAWETNMSAWLRTNQR